MPRRVQKL